MSKILIIDDNDHLALYLIKKLRDAGHVAMHALNGMSALNILEAYKPDVIFCDYFLPSLNGDKLCSIIRRMEHLHNPYLVIMSAAASELNLDLSSIDADAVIAKDSFKETLNHLLTAIEQAQNRRKGRKRPEIMGLAEAMPRRVTQELLAKNRHLQTILDSISEGIVEICGGRIVYANPTTLKILEKTQDQLIAIPFSEVFEEKTKERVLPILKTSPDSGNAAEVILNGFLGNKTVNIKRLPFQGDPDTIILLISDITERVHAEQLLRNRRNHLELLVRERTRALQQATDSLQRIQKLEAIGTLAGGIAHDFNNVLTAMIGFMEMAQIHKQADKQQHCIQQALEVSERAKGVINQILIFSRHQEQGRKPVQIGPVIKEEIKLLKSLLPSTIQISHAIADDDAVVLADVTQVQQVLMNLCTNAFHAMRENGGILSIVLDRIQIEPESMPHLPCLPSGDYLRLSVRDTGHGIDRSILGRIFDPFFTTKKPEEGTGLGLSVVYGIVRDHHGAIDVESEPGKGSTFNIYLPLIAEKESLQTQTVQPIAGGKERILLVDDETAVIEVETSMLTSLGYRVTALKSSIEALNLFRDRPHDFDLVITDMTMPHMRGDHLAREMLKIRQDVPLILCTGFSEMITEEKAREIGIRRFIMKPIYLKDLDRAIREVLAQ